MIKTVFCLEQYTSAFIYQYLLFEQARRKQFWIGGGGPPKFSESGCTDLTYIYICTAFGYAGRNNPSTSSRDRHRRKFVQQCCEL